VQYSSNPEADAHANSDAQEAHTAKFDAAFAHAIREICGGEVSDTAEVLGDFMCGLTATRKPLTAEGPASGLFSDAEVVGLLFSESTDDALIAQAARELRERYINSEYAAKVIERRAERLAGCL
jgi:hypothetical protein